MTNRRIEVLLSAFDDRGARPAIIDRGRAVSYQQLSEAVESWAPFLRTHGIEPGSVAALQSDYSLDAISFFVAVLRAGAIAALVPPSTWDDTALLDDAHAHGKVSFLERPGCGTWLKRDLPGTHPLLNELTTRKALGFIIFSSGSTGRAKAVLHETDRFLAKFENAGKAFRTLTFLLFDHIAGLDTLFYGLASGGTVVFPDYRDPVSVARLIQDARVEVLPASPTFLRLFCLSEEAGRFDLSSLRIITYGSEPMDPSTLKRLGDRFPRVKLIQKYGTSEFGAPRSKSRGDGSLWLKLDGEGFSVCVRDGVLWVRADAAMVGYLNAPPPKIQNGWMCTGDAVEVDGEWMRILGRQSDLIIVGGEKVFPVEVEETILELPQFREAKVWGEKQTLIGQIVCAAVVANTPIGDDKALRVIRSHCRSKLARHKVPVKVCVSPESLVGSRHKISRI